MGRERCGVSCGIGEQNVGGGGIREREGFLMGVMDVVQAMDVKKKCKHEGIKWY